MAKGKIKKAVKKAVSKAVFPLEVAAIIAPVIPVIYAMNNKAGFKDKNPVKAVKFFNNYYVKGDKNAKHFDSENIVEDIVSVAKVVFAYVKKILGKKKKGEKLTATENEIFDIANATMGSVVNVKEDGTLVVSANANKGAVSSATGSRVEKKGSLLMYDNFGFAEWLQMNIKVGLLAMATEMVTHNHSTTSACIVVANVIFFIAKWKK